jgi:hypothetical protein
MRKLNNSHNAEIVLVTGSSGSWKTSWIKKHIKRRKRLIIWDAAKHEYGGLCVVAKTQRQLLALLKANLSGGLKVAFQPDTLTKELFDWWAKAVLAWGDCTAVAEELADVTSAGKAPDGWGQLLRKGRAYGIKIIGATQRPAESDKTIIGNLSMFHAGRQSRADDRKYMAKEMNLKPEDFLMDDGQYIEFIPAKMKHNHGKMT